MILSDVNDINDISSKQSNTTFSDGVGLFFVAGRLTFGCAWIMVVNNRATAGWSQISQSQSRNDLVSVLNSMSCSTKVEVTKQNL